MSIIKKRKNVFTVRKDYNQCKKSSLYTVILNLEKKFIRAKNKANIAEFKRGITKLCDHPRPPTTTLNQPQFCCHHPRPAIILLSPPMTTHNFAPTIHDHPQPAINLLPPPMTCHYFTTATHDLELY